MTDTPQEIMAREIFLNGYHEKDKTEEQFAKDKLEYVEMWCDSKSMAQAAISALKEAGWEITKRPLTPEEVEAIQCKLERGEVYMNADGYLQTVHASTPED